VAAGILPDDDIIHIERDPQVGGKFSFKVRRATQEIDHVGEYRELARPRRLAFTFDAVVGDTPADQRDKAPSVVSIDIASSGGGTELVLSHQGVPPEMRDQTRAGGRSSWMRSPACSPAADARARGVPLPRPAAAKAARSSR
jgi:uncharacterized protein YndB with AHSA1/START domain